MHSGQTDQNFLYSIMSFLDIFCTFDPVNVNFMFYMFCPNFLSLPFLNVTLTGSSYKNSRRYAFSCFFFFQNKPTYMLSGCLTLLDILEICLIFFYWKFLNLARSPGNFMVLWHLLRLIGCSYGCMTLW